jgi:hypothetical protein
MQEVGCYTTKWTVMCSDGNDPIQHDARRRLAEAVDLSTVAAWLGHERLDTGADLQSAR